MPGKQALDGKRLTAFAMDPDDLTIIETKTHALYDERAAYDFDDSLVKNIMANGVIQPVVVTKDGDATAVVDGRQRVKAAREANKRLKKLGREPIRSPCVVRRGDNLFGVSISANHGRKDDSSMIKAAKVQRYMDQGHSEDEAAVMFCVTSQAVKGLLKLLELSPKVRKAIDAGKLSASAAVQLHGLSQEEQDGKLEDVIETAVKTKRNGKRPSARKVAAAAGKPVPPGKKVVRKAADALGTTQAAKLLGWVLGELSNKDITEFFPNLKPVFDA